MPWTKTLILTRDEVTLLYKHRSRKVAKQLAEWPDPTTEPPPDCGGIYVVVVQNPRDENGYWNEGPAIKVGAGTQLKSRIQGHGRSSFSLSYALHLPPSEKHYHRHPEIEELRALEHDLLHQIGLQGVNPLPNRREFFADTDLDAIIETFYDMKTRYQGDTING